MADFDQAILEALNAGHAPQDIFDNFKNSKNPEKQKWYEQYSANMSDRDRESSVTTSMANEPNVSTLEYIDNLSPSQKALGVGGILAGSAALGSATYYGKKQIDINAAVKEQALKNQLPLSEKDLEFQRQNDISQRRLDIEERRVNGELATPELTPVEKIRLEREQLRLDAERKKFDYDEQIRQNNILKMAKEQTGPAAITASEVEAGMPTTSQQFSVQEKPVDYSLHPESAYAKQNINQPTGAPNVMVAPPADVAPAPVAPLTDKQRREKAMADLAEHRLEEAKKASAAAEAKRSETNVQEGQGKAFNNQDNTILANAEKIKADKAIEAAGVKKAPKPAPATSVAPPVAATPSAPMSDKFVLPISSNPAETALTKEQMSARNWISSQYGSPSKYFESVQDIHGGVPPSYNAAAGEKAIGKDAHQVVMDWRKANIEGPKVNLTHDMKKVMKGAGGMAVLMALPGFAEAAQNKDVGKMSDIFTDFFVLPFAQSREAGIPKAQEESTIAGKFKEASKLGSPYRSVPPPR